MSPYQWLLLSGLCVFLFSTFIQVLQILRRPNLDDLSQGKGSIHSGIIYSFSGGMSPTKKETANLHLPTYTAGIVFHGGSFLAIVLLWLHFLNIPLDYHIIRISFYLLILSSLCGFIIFIKRLISRKLRHLSTSDDYFSNILVTGFQILSAVTLSQPRMSPFLYVLASFLLLYIPVGKLKHIVFFVITRFYLGLFYGKRGVWPPNRRKA